jgi:hypothetical protein
VAEWGEANKASILEQNGVGKTKVVKTSGVEDFRNEIMLCSIVQAESLEDASKLFIGHPHLQIPEAWVEISELRPM